MARKAAEGTRERILEAAAEVQQARDVLSAAGGDPADQIVALTRYLAGCVADPQFRGCALRNYVAEFPGDDGAATRLALAFLQHARSRIDRLFPQAGGGGRERACA